MKHLFAAACLALSSGTAIAEPCLQDTQAEFRAVNDRADGQGRFLRKLTARADGQDLRLMDLPTSLGADVPPRPETPEIEIVEIDTDAVVCDADGLADDKIAGWLATLDAADAALSEFEAALQAREDAVADAETQAEEAPPETAGAPEAADEGEGAAPDVPPETAEAAPVPDDSGATATPQEPMKDAENDALFRRVISLPAAALRDTPSESGTGAEVPVFSVLYVYDENSAGGQEWLQVGDSLRAGPRGWIRADESLRWSSMLVMQFAPRGQRERVLFFDGASALSDIVNSPFYSNEARDIYGEIESERDRLARDPGATANWNRNLVAIEPETAVKFSQEAYLLPILDWRAELFDGLVETTLLQVAAIPAAATTIGKTSDESFRSDADDKAQRDGEFRVGVVFVMDTTISMSPFIERTRQVVKGFYDAFDRFESSAFVSFGLVGFRDDVEQDPDGIEYVTRIFQPLDPEAPSKQVLSNMGLVEEAQAPTIGFEEDVYAGLTDAIDEMDWSPYDARIVILVTDASAREAGDPLARDPGLTAETVAASARAGNIAIVPVHLLTPTNRERGDDSVAAEQYRVLGETGDLNVQKYLAVDATSDAQFGDQLRRMADDLARNVLSINSGEVAARVELEPVPESGAPTDGALSNIVGNEIFRAQLESLAKVDGGDAPAFLAGWASDRDMLDPSKATLEVSVFLTRNQLSSLDKNLDAIVGAFRSGGDDPQAFFDNLQVLAAEMSTDPDAVRADDRLAVETLMPKFLQNLPYKSEILRLDRDYWSSLSVAAREEFIEAVKAKQRIYQDTFDQSDLWTDFGSDDTGLETTLVQLKHLP